MGFKQQVTLIESNLSNIPTTNHPFLSSVPRFFLWGFKITSRRIESRVTRTSTKNFWIRKPILDETWKRPTSLAELVNSKFSGSKRRSNSLFDDNRIQWGRMWRVSTMYSHWVAIWVFQKIGVPQNGWFIMENPIKKNDLGVQLFSETLILPS